MTLWYCNTHGARSAFAQPPHKWCQITKDGTWDFKRCEMVEVYLVPVQSEELTPHHAQLLAQVLGDILVAFGGIADQPMTGPELLAHAGMLVEHLKHPRFRPGGSQMSDLNVNNALIDTLTERFGVDAMERVKKRLAGEPHTHHKDCIHNLSADEQIALRGRTREWWEKVGLPEPIVIDPSQWEAPR